MKKAFTLIELLVVIAIIAILAAILFPVFAQAKAAAKKTVALSSAKQTALACLIYSGDSNDQFPIGLGHDWITALDGGWAWDTQPYIKSYPMLLDPSDTKSHYFWQTWFDYPGTPAVSISFAANSYLSTWNNVQGGIMNQCQGKDMNGTISRQHPEGISDGWMGGSCSTSQTSVSHIADTIMLASHYSGNNYFGPGSSVISGRPWWDNTGPGDRPDPKRDGKPYTIGSFTANKDNRFGAVSVYGNQGVFAFADGHAKTMNPLQTVPPTGVDDNPNADSSKNLWDALRP